MNNKKQYYQLDEIGFIGKQENEVITKEEKKAISDFIKSDKLKKAKVHLGTTQKTHHLHLP